MTVIPSRDQSEAGQRGVAAMRHPINLVLAFPPALTDTLGSLREESDEVYPL